MNKKLLLVFAAIFSCSAAFAQTDEQWTVYDLQTNEQQTIDLTDDMVPTLIVGSDDRKEITGNANSFEKAAVVLEIMASLTEGKACSGAMVGEKVVLTAAHCLTHKGQRVKSVKVIASGVAEGGNSPTPNPNPKPNPQPNKRPKVDDLRDEFLNRMLHNKRPQDRRRERERQARQLRDKYFSYGISTDVTTSNNTGFPSANAAQLWVPSQWNGQNDKYDYGIIILDSNLGKKTGWLNVAAKSTNALSQKDVIVIGRGTDKDLKTLWRSEGRIGRVEESAVYLDADIVSGNSGSPILLAEDPRTIVAVMSFERRPKGETHSKTLKAPQGTYPNVGLRITNAILNAIQQNSK